MRKVSEIAFNQLKVGDWVLSDTTLCYGEITQLSPQSEVTHKEDDEVVIRWNINTKTGKRSPESRVWHFWLNKVSYLGAKLA